MPNYPTVLVDICRIRLDYDTFVLTQPDTNQATQGQCLVDIMTVRHPGNLMAILATILYSLPPQTEQYYLLLPHMETIPTCVVLIVVCIVSTNRLMFHVVTSHVALLAYLDLSCESTDTATISFTLGDATLNQWKIKVFTDAFLNH